MKLTLKITQPNVQKNTCLILCVYSDHALIGTAKEVDQACGHYITNIIKKSSFSGKAGQILPILASPNNEFEQILLIGAGDYSHAMSPEDFRRIVFAASQGIETYKIKEATTYLCELAVATQSLAWKVKQTAEIIHDAFYRFDIFKSKKEPGPLLKELIIPLPDKKSLKACEVALAQGEAIANGVTLTRNLSNTPSNICTPTYLAHQARALAKQYRSIKVNVLSEKEMQTLKMGGILGVAQGSAEEAKLICLEYKGTNKKSTPIALVGKGVTFDTGGNSIKPAENMVGMKYDMCGAATVLGTLQAVAALKLPIHLVGVIPAVENMPGGMAYKPEDILKTMSGQTVEIISTDAEGRVILADALTYCERYKPDVVIDIATLTGAVVIALGFHATGLLSNNAALAQDLLKAGIESNDRAWELPLWDVYQEQIKSPFADMANTGGRAAGTITAACFLSRFAKKFKWAHLDVAGTAAMMMGTTDRKATGRPVYLLMQYLINQAQKHDTHSS